MTDIERLLRDNIGLDPASLGSSSILRTIRLRMKALGVANARQYQQLLHTSRAEWAELVEAVVVTETWFFRDHEPFTALVRLVREEWLPTHPAGQLRLLSLPCSSGEEPYSMAMALLDSGLPADRFLIDALDLSARALAKARHGVYGRNSFRGKDLAFRDRWFQPVKEFYVLAPALRRSVRFSQANLLNPNFPTTGADYDFIFCRNLLIYFDRQTQAKALQKLQCLLAPSGLLFVGAAEQPLVLEWGFVSANLPLAFACRKADAPEAFRRQSRVAMASNLSAGAVAAREARGASKHGTSADEKPLILARSSSDPERRGPAQAQASRANPPPGSPPDLAQARRLADAGQLDEAAALCEAHLKQSRASAPGWYLLGLVHEARGNPAAVDCYRKALYLQPNHYESLLQLASLAERSGDTTRARTYKRRAERSQNAAH